MHLRSWLVGLLCLFAEHGTAAGDTPDLFLSPNKSEPMVLFSGDSYVVTCVSRSGEQMTWLGPNKGRISEKGRVHVEGGKQTLSLVFSKAEKKDMGTYTCVSRIQGEERSVSFQLFVYVPISFVDTAIDQEANENTTSALIRCEVRGDPEPSIIWEVNGTSVADNPKYKVGGDGLFINNVTLDDGGIYKCQALQLSPHISNMQERSINVKILHGPKGKNEDDTAYGFINGTKNLTCEASAEPPPKFKWMKNNVAITKNEDIAIIKSKYKSILQIFMQNTSYFGEYVCVATNKYGTLEQIIHVKEGNKPEVPTVNIRRSTDDTIELDIVAPNTGELEILSYHIEYTPVKQGTITDWNNANVLELDEPPFKIEGLMQNTKYMLRLAARNAAGLSDYTSEYSITTASRETLPTSSSAQSMHLVKVSSYLLMLWCLLLKSEASMVISVQL